MHLYGHFSRTNLGFGIEGRLLGAELGVAARSLGGGLSLPELIPAGVPRNLQKPAIRNVFKKKSVFFFFFFVLYWLDYVLLWAARSVVERYGVPPDRVFVVPGGANVDEEQLQSDEDAAPPPGSPLRLGFIGVDWRRKNLPFILDVADSLQRRGREVTVEALGFAASEGPAHPLLRVHGFLHKVRDAVAFRSFIRGLHFGCLFSHAEAYGLSNVECLRLGVPVLTWNVGGLADTVPEGMGIVFPVGTSPDAVADVLEDHIRDESKYMALRASVRHRAREMSWDITVARMSGVWSGAADDRFDRVGDQPRRMQREVAPAPVSAFSRT